MDGDGPARGHCPDIFSATEKVNKSLHFFIDPRATPLKRIEADLKDRQLDVVCGA